MGVFKHVFKSFQHQLSIQIATISVLTGTFLIVALSFTVYHNLELLLTRWGREVELSVYLKDNITQQDQSNISQALQVTDLFNAVDYLSKEKALELFNKKMGQLSPALVNDSSFANPLPASFEARLKSGVSDVSGYKAVTELAQKVSAMNGVEDVSYGQGWIENYATAIQVFKATSTFLVSILLLGGVFVVGNSIRNSIALRREEIAVLELFGATQWSIQKPYIVEGLVLGVISAALSLLVSFMLFQWAHRVWVEELHFWSQSIQFEFITASQLFVVLLLSSAVGMLGSYFSIRKINTGWSAAQP